MTALRDFRGWQDRPRNALAAFQGKAEDLEAGREARIAGFQALLPALARAHECARIHPVETESDRRGKAELEGHVADLEGRIDQLQAYAELSEVEGRITRQRRPLIAGVLCAGVGLVVVMVAMALSANRYAAPAVAAPMPVVVQLGDDDASTLAETMAAKDENGPGPSTSSSEPAQGAEQRCSANSGELVEGLAVGGSWTQPVILLDEPGCPALTLETQDSTVEPAVSAPDNAKDSAISERVPVKAWLGPTHREELLRERNGAAEICHAVAGQPVDADAVGGTWGQPYLIVRAIAETSSTFACGPVSLQRHDPETRVQPASTG